MEAVERVDFPEFVTGLIQGFFKAIVSLTKASPPVKTGQGDIEDFRGRGL